MGSGPVVSVGVVPSQATRKTARLITIATMFRPFIKSLLGFPTGAEPGVVVAGDGVAVDAFVKELAAVGRHLGVLAVPHAWHVKIAVVIILIFPPNTDRTVEDCDFAPEPSRGVPLRRRYITRTSNKEGVVTRQRIGIGATRTSLS